MKNQHTRFSSSPVLRLLLLVTGIASCLFGIQAAARYGFSRLLITYSLTSGNVAAAKKAIQLAPKDAEAHFAGAAVLSLSGSPDQAVGELEQAVALRPTDYGLWSELGLLRDQTRDTDGALLAFNEAVKRAPYYSQPRWNRGNLLLRQGQYEAAFADLNQAAKSNPGLIPSLISLSWGVSRGDVKLAKQLAQIDTDVMRAAFATFLSRHGKAKEALAEFGDARNVPAAIKRQLVDQLLADEAFKEAFDIWKVDHGTGATKEANSASIYDGGFEGPLAFAEGGFGWRVPRDLQATSVVLDSSQPHTGSQDLRVEFNGNANPGSLIVSQLILVEPSSSQPVAVQNPSGGRRYKISFASRSQDVVTGGPPLLVVTDAAGNQKRLGQSLPLAKGTGDWQFASFEFDAMPTTAAVVLSLQRENCTTSPCPIFGAISLDSFSIEELH